MTRVKLRDRQIRRQANILPRWLCLPCLSKPIPCAQSFAPPTNIADAIIDLPHLAGWKTRVRVIARVPKGARIKAAALSELLDNII